MEQAWSSVLVELCFRITCVNRAHAYVNTAPTAKYVFVQFVTLSQKSYNVTRSNSCNTWQV